jgi:hypothetical protein
VDEGAVDAALSLDELSVVDAVLVLEAPLPLYKVSDKSATEKSDERKGGWLIKGNVPIIAYIFKHVVILQMRGLWSRRWARWTVDDFRKLHPSIERFATPVRSLKHLESMFSRRHIRNIFEHVGVRFSPPKRFGEFRHIEGIPYCSGFVSVASSYEEVASYV